ncbi:MAG: hypothetical protein EOO46_19745 [Flavobacterium sp.]|nr:MAG: hypothetical protein EOO46_19745 [Flavobacterium sp.]
MKIRILWLILILLTGVVVLFVKTNLLIPEPEVIQSGKKIGAKIVSEIHKRETGKDTIFLSTGRWISIECGLEERNPYFFSTFKDQCSKLRRFIRNPYVLQNDAYDDIDDFKHPKIIVGHISSEGRYDNPQKFYSDSIHFDLEPFGETRKIYYINFVKLRENEVHVSIYDSIRKVEKHNFKIVSDSGDFRLKED